MTERHLGCLLTELESGPVLLLSGPFERFLTVSMDFFRSRRSGRLLERPENSGRGGVVRVCRCCGSENLH